MATNAPTKMKKLVNDVADLVPESLAGLGRAHADILTIDQANLLVLRAGGRRGQGLPCVSGGVRVTSRSTAGSSAWAC
jgi:hypothetical protein